MRYAIISDIHSNLEALEAVLIQIENYNVEKIYCLGDIVGYGPNPEECIKLVKKNCDIVVQGNHDSACLKLEELDFFNHIAKASIFWTLKQLSNESLDFLSKLKLQHGEENFHLIHSSPFKPLNWDYILSIGSATLNFLHFDEQICFYGHSHVPLIYTKKHPEIYNVLRTTSIQIEEDKRYLINIGSVGQPRDRNPKASFAIYDSGKLSYEIVRVAYNIKQTQQKMRDNFLPDFLIERLQNGA